MARVVVVGGGIAGTAAAARLAKHRHEVVLLERRDRLGGAVGFLEREGFRWDTGPTATALPAVLRDLFRKSGRPLERELDLVPVQPVREHRFEDGTTLALPSGSRGGQLDAVGEALGPAAGQAWVDHVHSFAGTWDVLRRGYLERPWDHDHQDAAVRDVLSSRTSLHGVVRRRFRTDERLRSLALTHAVLDGHDPRNVPAWVGMLDYVEQNFGTWTVAGGLGALADAMTRRLGERRVDVRLGTTVRDLVVRDGRAVGVDTSAGVVDADVVVVAVDPRGLPALADRVRRTMPAIPPVVSHLGLRGDVPDLPHEVVLHGDPTLVVRTGGSAPEGGAAWTVLGRGRLSEDVLVALARRGVDVREQVVVRVDRSPREQVVAWGGSPYGVLWQGRATVRQRLGTRTPVEGVYAAGAHVAGTSGLPFATLTAAVVAERIGEVPRATPASSTRPR
ncbi:phytoene desaturase family protein [Nocardioides iriomotensis]|uniref:FAD-dependent oxidoreductase n=1 Tax=Nocardioides iriomotensis TaxID=715784 RepID=A0A4Q5J061_9ACTN|nr:FAD-dependent oxidoreductase [Nocardioides iriomotensis]RYU11832.1 FAD-dependent oxidoreductase [Nocardioides iriomotensis]